MRLNCVKYVYISFLLALSSFAQARFITTIELENTSTGINFTFDKVVWEWASLANSGIIGAADLTSLTMTVYNDSNLVFEDIIISNKEVNYHMGFERFLTDVIWTFDFTTLTLLEYDNYGPWKNLNGQNPYISLNVFGQQDYLFAAQSQDQPRFETSTSKPLTSMVPEPSLLSLFTLGLFGLIASRKRAS